jgi:TonB-dependent SusC/RagA subfamily outer membrane receptor
VAGAWGADIDKRSTKDVGQDLFGQVLGLQTLQESSRFGGTSTSNYIRGIQSTSSHPLIIVDGIEREITDITPEEVENVTVLKDAAAAALYGYKGANGVLVITTKHGLYNKKEIHASYEHLFNWMERRPSFVDGYTYASAVNEARANEGSTPVFDENSLNAYKNGTLPYNFPNVNWLDECSVMFAQRIISISVSVVVA